MQKKYLSPFITSQKVLYGSISYINFWSNIG